MVPVDRHGIGPFLSMLRTGDPWAKFGRVVLVHSVRHAEELTYREEIHDIERDHPGAFDYVPMVSRDAHRMRWPAASRRDRRGRLETRSGVPLTPENAHAMLCGNPAMVDDVQKVLATRGMRRHRRKEPGHITLETYWYALARAAATRRGSCEGPSVRRAGDSVREVRAMRSRLRCICVARGSAKRFHRLNAPAIVDASCGLMRIQRAHLLGGERVACAVRRIEAREIAQRERRRRASARGSDCAR